LNRWLAQVAPAISKTENSAEKLAEADPFLKFFSRFRLRIEQIFGSMTVNFPLTNSTFD
jgi:hypothetical protein